MPAASGKGNITVPELVENGRKKLQGTLDSLSPTSLLPQDIRLYPKLSKFWLGECNLYPEGYNRRQGLIQYGLFKYWLYLLLMHLDSIYSLL